MNTATVSRLEATIAARVQQAATALHAIVARLRSSVSRASATHHHIDRGATTWIARPLGRTITCDAGTLWLTFDGEPIDVILEAGQTHRCVHPSRLGIHALEAAAVRVA